MGEPRPVVIEWFLVPLDGQMNKVFPCRTMLMKQKSVTGDVKILS